MACSACGSTQRESRRAVPTLNDYEFVPCGDRWHEEKTVDRTGGQASNANAVSAIRAFLKWGEEAFVAGHQCGYFSGNGWAATQLRAHLAELEAAQPSGTTAPQEAEKELRWMQRSITEWLEKARERGDSQMSVHVNWFIEFQKTLKKVAARLTPEASSAPAQETGEILQVVQPFQHPGYVVRRAVPRPLVDTDDEPAASTGTAPQGWQPIDTAPKDGTVLLLYAEAYHRIIWGRGWYFKGVPGDGEGWIAHSFYTQPKDDMIGAFEPTHWHPLPSPPPEPTTGGQG